MRMVPVVFGWMEVDVVADDGATTKLHAMVPTFRYRKVAAKQFADLEEYPLVVLEARSRESHNAYFAEVGRAYDNLPEDLAPIKAALALKTIPPGGFLDAEHLRKWALCETGHCDVIEFDFDSANDVRKVAALYRKKDSYAQIVVRGTHITIKEAWSQSAAAMSKEPFEKSKRDVLDLLSTMIGVKRGELQKQARRSA